MSQTTTTNETIPRGYRSARHRQTFTIGAGLLGLAFFIGQFILPMILMFPVMLGTVSEMSMAGIADTARSAFRDGSLWYVESPMPQMGAQGAEPALERWRPGGEAEPEKVAVLPLEQPWLLAGADHLWFLSGEGIGRIEMGEPVLLHRQQLGSISRPFLLDGLPAVVSSTPEGWSLEVFRDGSWKSRFSMQGHVFPPGEGEPVRKRFLAEGNSLHLFQVFEGTLFHGVIDLEPAQTADVHFDLKPIAGNFADWDAVLLEEAPAVLIRSGETGLRLTGKRYSGGEWTDFIDHRAGGFGFGLDAVTDGGRLYLLQSGFPGGFPVVAFEDGKIAGKWTCGRSTFAFPFKMMFTMWAVWIGSSLLLPFILAVLLSVMMARYRTDRIESGGRSAVQAPLWRRAVAQIVDGAIALGPVAAGYLSAMSIFLDFDDLWYAEPSFAPPLASFALVFLGFVWALVYLVIAVVLEGKLGRTPGKWLTGIRVVGIDLQPCGIGRSLVRNLLKCLDGFFNFMIGMLLVALTENWQRVGDMAARTVVVMAPLRSTGLTLETEENVDG